MNNITRGIKTFLYKDAEPIETVTLIRNILSKLGLLITEDRWYRNGSYLYSVHISLDD
jgi:hypothetical protein